MPGEHAPGTACLAWVSHPLRDEPAARSLCLAGLIAATGAAFGWSFDSLSVTVFAAAVLVLSLSRYFLPTRYVLDDRGFRVSHAGRSRRGVWSEVARVVPRPDGVFLSPFPRPSRLDPFRGVFLRTKGDPGKVLAYVLRATTPAFAAGDVLL